MNPNKVNKTNFEHKVLHEKLFEQHTLKIYIVVLQNTDLFLLPVSRLQDFSNSGCWRLVLFKKLLLQNAAHAVQ